MTNTIRSAFIYALCSKLVYVGKTINLKQRLGAHRNTRSKFYLGRAIRKHGWDDFVVVILAQGVTEDRAFELEKMWIADLETRWPGGYNLTIGGDNVIGLTKESRAKISAANRSRKYDAADRKKRSEAQRRRYSNPEERRKTSEAGSGDRLRKQRSESASRLWRDVEYRMKTSKAHLRENLSAESRLHLSEGHITDGMVEDWWAKLTETLSGSTPTK